MGDVWFAPVPRCPVHNPAGQGTMRLDMAMDTWTCPGWDGEGCDYRVREEDRARDYQPLGTTDATFAGLPVVVDDSMPPGEALLRAGDQEIRFTLPLPPGEGD